MQTFTLEFQAELEKGRTDPSVLVSVYEFYESDYIPDPILGFDPTDAIERFAGQELTWNGVAYRREVISRGDIVLNLGEKTNSVSVEFSNISRYLATWAQSQAIEGKLLCIRIIAPAVTNDSKAAFHGRCDKPGDVTKGRFPLTARQDFGNLNQQAPPSKFTADDPNGRLPGDDLYEGIPFTQVGGSYQYPFVRQSNGFLGRLFGRRTTDTRSEQFSSLDLTPYGSPIREVFGRCQIELRPFISIDKGVFIAALWEACRGPIAAITNIRTLVDGLTDPINSFENPPDPAIVHLGDPGGTGTNQGNTGQADLGGGSKFSHLAYVEGAIAPKEVLTNSTISDPNILNELPPVAALVLGRIVPLPDSGGDFTEEGWTDNLAYIARFLLTDPAWVNINPGFMGDSAIYLTGLHCDEPILDESDSQLIAISTPDIDRAGVDFTRYRPTGLITPRSILFDLGDDSITPELVDGPYLPIDPTGGPDDVLCPIGFHHDPDIGTCVSDVPGPVINATQGLLRKRYTGSFTVTDEIRAVDLLHKIVLPAGRLYLVVNGKGQLEIRTERPSSATRLRSATAVNATSIPVLDVTPWKSGPELLQGRIVISGGQVHSETRTVTSADYSTSGNSITLTASDTGGVIATASGATLSGGSTSVQASGTVTLTGTPDGTVTITIDGVSIAYILSATDTLITAAGMLAAYINATRRLRQYIVAEWSGAVVTIKCLHGALNVPALLKVHGGPIANPTTAPTVAAAASGSLQAGTYQVAYADVNSNGLTALTLLATVTLTANQKINVSSLPAFPAGVTSRQFFVSEKPGSTRLRYQATRTDAADFSINALPLPNAALPPSQNTTAEELIRVAMSFATNSQDVFPAWRPSTVVIDDDVYLPTVLNGHKYQVTTPGTTGSSEPTWPTTVGGTVASGTVVFTEIGSTVLQQAGLTRANVLKDTYKWPLGSMQSSVNVIEIPFRDATNDFALTTLRINDPVHQAQVKKKFPLKIDGSAIDNYNQAYRIGNGELSKNREGDWFNALEGPPAALVMEEGDLIASSDDSGGHINVITRIEELRIKPNHCVAITKARKYSTAMYSDDVGSHVIPIASTLRFVATLDSLSEFIDTPAIRESDLGRSGFFISASRDLAVDGDWRGFEVYVDYGDGYIPVAQGDVAATLGASTSALNLVSDTSVLDTLTFTADSGTDVLTATAHGFSDTQIVTVRNTGGGLPGGLVIGTNYFVRDATANTFKLALTSGGTAINITSNGTGTQNVSRGFQVTFDYVAASVPFSNATEAELLANPLRNLFLVDGEYVQAATIVDNGNRSFTLSDILHGRFETTSVSHAIGERVVYIDGAEVFIPTDPSRIGIAYNYKIVTTNQDVADATAVPFTWLGNILDPAKPTDLNAERDISKDWYASGIGHPTLAEMPESYVMRFRRASDAVFLRDVPVTPGTRLAAILQHIIHAEGGGTWSVTTHAAITNNNVYGAEAWSAAYATQPVRIGGEINARVTLPPTPASYLTAQVNLSFGLSDYTDPYGAITGAQFSNVAGSTTSTRISVYDWTTTQYEVVDVATIDGVVFVRIVWSGTEIRFQFSGSPINLAARPDVVLRDIPAPVAANHLRIALLNTGLDGVVMSKVENIIMGGLSTPATIYSLAQQEQDLLTAGASAPTAALGIVAGDLDVEMWQTSPIAGITGRSVRGVF